MMTVIKSDVKCESDRVKAKMVIFEDKQRELYLSEVDSELEDGDEPDHLVIQIVKPDEIYINGHAVNQRIVDELIRFLSK